jgi:hypothetical protein
MPAAVREILLRHFNQKENDMKKNVDSWQTATAFHLSDEQVERLFSFRLRSILNREVGVYFSSDNDYWDVGLTPPLTEPEMEMLFAYANADTADRVDHQPYQNVVPDLSAPFATKLISKDFPAPVQSAIAVSDGLCLFTAFVPFEKVYEEMPQGYGESGDLHE